MSTTQDHTDARTGLSAAQVAERVAAGRTNDVPARASRSVGEIVRSNVFTRFNAIVGVLFAIILVIGPIQDGLFGLVIIINTLIGIVQELRAKRTLERLAIVGEARPRVRRDGVLVELAPSGVVLDDVIDLGPGDKIVVDGVVLAADGLEIDESLLTGEPDPVPKQPGDQVLSGSFVTVGSGAHQATKVGRAAYAAQLAEEASRFTLVGSELRSGIDKILQIAGSSCCPRAAPSGRRRSGSGPTACGCCSSAGLRGRVLRLAIPAGVIAGTATVVTYLLARADPSATEIQQSTAAVVTLYLVATWVLLVVALPLAWWKAGMIIASLAAFGYALFLPIFFGQAFWLLGPDHAPSMTIALIVAAVAAAAVEFASWVVHRRASRPVAAASQ